MPLGDYVSSPRPADVPDNWRYFIYLSGAGGPFLCPSLVGMPGVGVAHQVPFGLTKGLNYATAMATTDRDMTAGFRTRFATDGSDDRSHQLFALKTGTTLLYEKPLESSGEVDASNHSNWYNWVSDVTRTTIAPSQHHGLGSNILRSDGGAERVTYGVQFDRDWIRQ